LPEGVEPWLEVFVALATGVINRCFKVRRFWLRQLAVGSAEIERGATAQSIQFSVGTARIKLAAPVKVWLVA